METRVRRTRAGRAPEGQAAGAAGRHPVHAASGRRLGAAAPQQESAPADLRLLPPAAAAWAAAAMALGAPARVTAACVLGLLLVAGVLPALGRRPAAASPAGPRTARRLPVAAAMTLLCAAAAATLAGLHTASLRAEPWPRLEGERAEFEVTLTADPATAGHETTHGPNAPPRVLLRATASRVTGPSAGTQEVHGPVLLVVEAQRPEEWLRLLPSTQLRLRAGVRAPLPGRAAEFAAVLRVREAGSPHVVSGPNAAHRLAGSLRDGLREAASHLPGSARGLLPALVIGDGSGLGPELAEAVTVTGLTHLVVVSGAQLTLVLVVLTGAQSRAGTAERGGLAARFGLPLRATAAVGCALVAAFVLVCRPDPSVLRAAVCAGIAMLALATGRRRSLLPALAAAVLLLVLHDPTLARSFGFLLSVLATGSLLTLAPRWGAALRRRGLPGPPAEALAAAAAAHVVCAPVVTVFSASTSLVAVPCNLLAGAAVGPVVVLGWAALITAPFAMPVAIGFAWLASWPTRWIAAVARGGAALPGAELGWPGGWAGGALLAAVTVAACVLLRRVAHRPWPALCCALLLVCAVLRPLPLPRLLTGWPPPGWRLVVCDVGQGDGLVLTAGGHSALVVDTGPDPALMDRCLRELGVSHIPLLLLSHFHADHVGGLSGALRGRRVDAIESTGVRDPPGQAEFVERVAAEAGVPLVAAIPGERRRIGEELDWEVLWPPAGAAAAGLAANDASVTLLLRTGGLTVLLPGDLEPAAQQRLLATRADLSRVDVLKVPHHGSAAQEPKLFERLAPRLALVSCGEDNGYGHPAPRTLAALEEVGATVLRTDTDGALAVRAGPEGPRATVRDRPG
ncbi:ComEC/Rec2 family competence protein [Streptomyces hoynatensis]|uniref:MBL fold metallo-hydrolase n=1 Tax=Streptomyces hoynatensis TaxID=1141874 RepID=A0A3A9ZBJ7_9ACTN|nr:ComEC/Rec2 family competence protein [Streptomyces hoynatensis]RKN45638.1 MBL fold metallo-hydrolase [Streptomyces hoynatensis]